MKLVDDPERPGQKAYVEQVYLVREPEWESYPIPDHIRDIIARQSQEPGNRLSAN
jgi:hypothetical protein